MRPGCFKPMNSKTIQKLLKIIVFLLNLQLGVWRIHVQDVPLYQQFEHHSFCFNFGGNLHRTIFGHNTSDDMQTNVDAKSATGKILLGNSIISQSPIRNCIFQKSCPSLCYIMCTIKYVLTIGLLRTTCVSAYCIFLYYLTMENIV